MAQQTFEELADAVKQAESRGKRYGADDKTLTTSAKGALGEMQVMPKTVRDPGFGVAPAKDKSPDEIARVGRDYLQAMLGKYGDKNKALIAYNMGPGSTDKWIAAGEKLDKLPEETRTYVQRVNKLLGRDVPRETNVVKKPREPLPESLPPMAATPTVKPEAAERVASLGPGYQAALALSFLADTDEPEGDTTATQEFMAKRQEERDAAEEAALLQEQAARPAVLAELADTKIRSPFAAPQPQKMAGGGLPYVPTSRISSSARKQLDEIKAKYENFNAKVDAYNENKNDGKLLSILPLTLEQAMLPPVEEYKAMATAASKSAMARNLALAVASNPEQFNFSMDNLFADGGEARALLTSFVKRAEGSPEEGEVAPRITMQQIEALAAQDAAEREEASKPVFGLARTPSSGIGRTAGPVSNALNSGDAYIAAAKGVTEMPYNLLGAPMDLTMLARQALTGQAPAGQTGTSEYIKKKATELGIRPAPPTDPTLRGFYDVGDIGSSIVNPASVPRAAARGTSALAQKTGEAAKMLEDVTVGNIQRGRIRRAGEQVPPDTAYDPLRERMETQGNLALAVRNKGTPYLMTNRRDTSVDGFIIDMDRASTLAFRKKYPDVNFFDEAAMRATPDYQKFAKPIDEAEYAIKYEMQPRDMTPLRNDPAVATWFNKTIPAYFRKDFGTPEDQLVKAADQDKLLHFEAKKGKSFGDDARDANEYVRRTEGFSEKGEAKTPYGKRVENTIDATINPAQLEDVSLTETIPPSLLPFTKTNPEKRITQLSPNLNDALKLTEMRSKMLQIRQVGPEYSAYGQPAIAVPKEFMLPDNLLPRLNLAEVSNRVARFTRWEDETRQGMATTAIRNNPEFIKEPLSNGDYIGVAIPDVINNPKIMSLVTDLGCDGGWCTAQEELAKNYGSGTNQLFVIVTGKGKQSRPVAQISVENVGKDKNGNNVNSIVDIKEKGDTSNFLTNPALPAIQEYVQSLDKLYGGFKYILDINKLNMNKLPENPMELLRMGVHPRNKAVLEDAFDTEIAGLAAVRDEAIRLNNGSVYTIGDEDEVAKLLDQATRNMLGSYYRATGGMVERQSADNRRYL